MRIFGRDMGYDEPFFYFGSWEFFFHDDGWLIAKERVVRREGSWPTYWTIRPWRNRKKRPETLNKL